MSFSTLLYIAIPVVLPSRLLHCSDDAFVQCTCRCLAKSCAKVPDSDAEFGRRQYGVWFDMFYALANVLHVVLNVVNVVDVY